MAMATFSGSLVLVVLTVPMGVDMFTGIIGAVGLGTVLAIPVSIMVAKAMSGNQG